MNARRGFTLIELLVAVSLATIITVLGVSLMRTSINTSVSNQEALVERQSVRDVQRLIELAWSGRLSNGFRVKSNQIEFVSGRKALGSLPLRFVCEPGEKNDFALWFYKVPPPAGPSDGPSEELVGELLLGNLGACRFGFLQAPADDKQSAQWKEDWPAGKDPPAVIRLDLATLRGALPPFILAAGGS